ncbi:hypothetical protein EIK77_005448 [Talaromyces pinophilus]|nr:hypothetical protein EIK77_005448 [Talaromyces pinophilus]PCG88566.1 Hypothetical protein PENO1_109490 [Penicillium occitanis (nom. inval.)]PCG88765.1 hypothetical protein PENOC_109470 [Penicillium occitanis (nom. inval.)]
MSITLKKFNSYTPLSLPARPSTSTYPIPYHHTTSSPPSGAVRSVLAPLPTIPLSSLAQIPLHHPLPARPQTLNAPGPDPVPAIPPTCRTNHVPTCPNDFDHALQDPLFTASDNRKGADSPNATPAKGDLATPIDRPVLDLSSPKPPDLSPDCFQTPGLNIQRPSSPSADADADAAPMVIRDQSEAANPLNDTLSTGPEPLPAPCTANISPAPSIGCTIDSTATSIGSSALNISAIDREDTDLTSCTYRVEGHSSGLGKSPPPIQSIEFEALGGPEFTRTCPAERSLDETPTLSKGAAGVSTPIVVIPPLPHPSDPSLGQEQVSEEQDRDSGPSDDEKDADYEDSGSDTERIHKRMRSSKRRKINLLSEGALSDHETRPLSRSRASSQKETTPTSDRIPVQGVLTLGWDGSKVVYYFELSQTAFSPPVSRPPSSHPLSRTGNRRKRKMPPYTCEENKYILELKDKNLLWAEIEEQFAERFPRRKRASLQVHYHTKLK